MTFLSYGFRTLIKKLLVSMKPCDHLLQIDDAVVRAEPVRAINDSHRHVFALTAFCRPDFLETAFRRMCYYDFRPFIPYLQFVFFDMLNH